MGVGAEVGDPDPSSILDAVPEALLLIDDRVEVRWCNAAAVRLFGMTMEEAEGRSGLEFVHPDDLALAALSLESVQSKEVGTPIEVRIRSTDGWRLVEVIGSPQPTGTLLSLRDLTDRRRWEVAGDEVARFRSLMQNAASLTMLLRRGGEVSASSGALTRLLGHDQEQLEGRPFANLVHPDDHPRLGRLLDQLEYRAVVPGGEHAPVTEALRLCHVDGTVVPFALTFTDLFDDPTVEGIVVTGHDISDRVQMEEELRAANSVLAATLESTADGILVIDEDMRIVNFNGRFAEMWRIPEGTVRPGADASCLAWLAEQLRDPEAMMAWTAELEVDPAMQTHDILEFSDGRVFERLSLPQRIHGEVVGRVWSFRDITEHRRLEGELAHQAFHDSLTGLANQALFRDRVEHAANRLERRGGRLAVLFIDLDEFKTVNDSLGHSAGDTMLVTVSERLRGCIRLGDTAARLGGDEFAILIEELVDHDDAVGVAERVIEALREPIALDGTRVSTTASVGIAFADAAIGVDEILRNADLAMYTAKADGKNCYRVFADDMHRAALERLDLESHLRGAADRGELVVHYQPIFDLRTGELAVMEALVRWQHPERGLLGPLAFIPFAEESDLIDEIGHHVLATAVAEAAMWQRVAGAASPAVSVNLSPRQLGDPSLPERVELLLHRCGLPAALLILEITEGALMKDPAGAIESLGRLSRLGVRLAVDDFGTGYSSLAYLQQFPVDILKVDRSFVTELGDGERPSLASAIVQISHTLGLVAIAEGIESQDQADALGVLGCDLGQGFHLGRPTDAEGAARLVASEAASRPAALASLTDQSFPLHSSPWPPSKD